MSLGRFSRQDTGQENLHWGRAAQDNAPYRGPQLPLLKEEEAEALLEKSYDVGQGTFDTTQPEQKHCGCTLREVLERTKNGWYELLSWNERWSDRDGVPVMYVFAVWSAPYMEPNQAALQHATQFLQFGK